MRILLDCDGVLADFAGASLDFLRRNCGVTRAKKSITSTEIAHALGLSYEQIEGLHNAWRKPGFARGIKPLRGSKQFVRELKKRGKVTVVTSPMADAWMWKHERREWLFDHYGLDDVVFTAEKHQVGGDVLIDDNAEIIRTFPGRRILFDQPWNQGVDLPRAYCYNEILEALTDRNTSGCRGVSWNKPHRKWQSRIMINGKRRHLGLFDNILDAAASYDSAYSYLEILEAL